MTRKQNGQFVARFRNGAQAAVGDSQEIVAEKIIEYMKAKNPNAERYKKWKTSMILNEQDDESESSNTVTSNASERAEI